MYGGRRYMGNLCTFCSNLAVSLKQLWKRKPIKFLYWVLKIESNLKKIYLSE